MRPCSSRGWRRSRPRSSPRCPPSPLRTGAINLGQGFPDTDGPASLLADVAANVTGGVNQYPPGLGVASLRTAVAEHQKRFYGLDVDPDHVLITTGATEAIASAVLALCGPGDEVVTFQPYYDSYAATIALSGATLRAVPLRPPTFAFDPDELRAAFSPRTRVVLVNTPHNPTGTVLGREQLTYIGAARRRVRRGRRHRRGLRAHGLRRDRARPDGHAARPRGPHVDDLVRGKTFSVTGWKVGWVHGPIALVNAVRAVKQFLTYVSGAPFQPALATALGLPDSFYADLAGDPRPQAGPARRGLRTAGFTVFPTRGTYFVVTDVAPLGFDDGAAFCWRLPELIGVAAVPVSVFCADPDLGRTLVRFAFCKRDEVLTEAASRLASLRTLT